MKIPIIDNGHGGMIAGIYQTHGKRSPIWSDKSQLFEGEFNRAIKARVIELLNFQDIPYLDLVPENRDVTLTTRINRANKFHSEHNRNTFLYSIHSNAGGGEGCEVFISESASSKSKEIAREAERQYELQFPNETWRGIKRKNFTMVHKSAMPAVLFEYFFMDNERECKNYLLTQRGRDQIAKHCYDTILNSI